MGTEYCEYFLTKLELWSVMWTDNGIHMSRICGAYKNDEVLTYF